MSDPKLWPENVCSDDPARPTLHRPFRWRGSLIYSDGRALVRIADDGREANDKGPTMDGLWEVAWADNRAEPVTLPMDALREWCGPAESPCPECKGKPAEATEKCSECDGTGRDICTCECGEESHHVDCDFCEGKGVQVGCSACDGEGIVDRDTIDRRGSVGVQHFNPRLLANMLAGAPGETVTLIPATREAPAICVRVDGDSPWDGLLMPLRINSDSEAEPIESLLAPSTP